MTGQNIDTLNTDASIFVKTNSLLQRVNYSEIQYVESEGNYCTIYTTDSQIMIKISLTKLLQRFHCEDIVQVHRGYAINLNHVRNIDTTNGMISVEGKRIPLGRKYREALLDRLDIL